MASVMALLFQQADAQFNNIMTRLKYRAQQSVENGVVDAVTKAGKSASDSAKKKAKNLKKANADVATWNYGSHTYTMSGNLTASKYKKGAFGEVKFSNIPSDYDEFETLYYEFLGRTPHGTAAMMPMAMEIYARDQELGLKCIQLINYPSNVNSVTSRLKDKLYAAPGDSYGQRYLPAALIKGATAANGYTPERPYTIDMEASANKHQELKISGSGTVVYLYIIGGGWDSHQRQVELVLEPGKEHYQVFNCPSLYVGCQRIQGDWGGLE